VFGSVKKIIVSLQVRRRGLAQLIASTDEFSAVGRSCLFVVGEPDRRLVEAASDGDAEAYRGLVERHGAEIHAHCYRMLGSLHDAEDALQETLLRAWRGLPRLSHSRSLRNWLYRIATNVCLDALAHRQRRALPIDPGPADDEPAEPLAEFAWIEPYPDGTLALEDGYAAPEARYERREAIELAFIASLQHLPPRQRAVLVLREVLGFSAREVAESMDTTVASVNSSLQRARATVERRLPERTQQATVRSLGSARVRRLVERFIDAFERGDVDGILAMLTQDATFAMPPYARLYRGRRAIAASWLMPAAPTTDLRYLRARANAQPAMGAYRWDDGARSFRPIALEVLTLHGEAIGAVTAFRAPSLLERFDLPAELCR
jgi:RNA polymerase sigma-70 factor (ECF subfamily)